MRNGNSSWRRSPNPSARASSKSNSSTNKMTSLAPSVYDLPHLPLPSNSSPTDTLSEQATTERLISQLLQSLPPALTADEQNTTTASTSHSPTTRASLPIASATTLRKADHVPYICSTMYHLPAPYVSLDASRPWLLYWTMHSLDLLGCAVDQHSKDRYASHPHSTTLGSSPKTSY